jgi:molybdopterin-containing oxidoreductase family membrane subunit
MKNITFREMKETGRTYWLVQALIGGVILLALAAAHHMETSGHWVTGMNNQIVWGLPHVFLIVTASGELNIASIASVFGKAPYKPLTRLSALVAIAHLVGGLMILVLDLGRPERIFVPIFNFNIKSIFTWNMILYSGFIGLGVVYLWTMMERRFNPYTKAAGLGVFIWRTILTTGTGSIFGFLVSRDAYNTAIMAPMFIIMSFSYGTAIYLMTLETLSYWGNRPIGEELITRLKNLLGVFIAASFYFFMIYHLTNMYAAQRHGIEFFMLGGSSLYSKIFWIGQIFVGTVLPLALLYGPLSRSRLIIYLACILVVIGGLAQMYVTIIGGQAYPLTIFQGYEVTSSFFDGQVATYIPTVYEAMLGIGGFAVAAFLVILVTRMLPFIPASLADEDVDEDLVSSKH